MFTHRLANVLNLKSVAKIFLKSSSTKCLRSITRKVSQIRMLGCVYLKYANIAKYFDRAFFISAIHIGVNYSEKRSRGMAM